LFESDSTITHLIATEASSTYFIHRGRHRERAVAFDFEKLLVYQKALDFADQVCTHTERFQRGYGFLVDQLNRAALSISANIAEGNGRFTVDQLNRAALSIATNLAEGNGRFTKPDRRNFFTVARGSVQKCVPRYPSRKRVRPPGSAPTSRRIPARCHWTSGALKMSFLGVIYL
jgi:hypothetical protein